MIKLMFYNNQLILTSKCSVCWSCCCECTVGPTEEILSPAAVTQQEKSARKKKYQKPSGRSDVSERAGFKATAADLTEASQISADITGS